MGRGGGEAQGGGDICIHVADSRCTVKQLGKVKVFVALSYSSLASPWTVACHAPLSMGFSTHK